MYFIVSTHDIEFKKETLVYEWKCRSLKHFIHLHLCPFIHKNALATTPRATHYHAKSCTQCTNDRTNTWTQLRDFFMLLMLRVVGAVDQRSPSGNGCAKLISHHVRRATSSDTSAPLMCDCVPPCVIWTKLTCAYETTLGVASGLRRFLMPSHK